MTPKQALTLPKTPNAPIIAEKPIHPPLKSRVQINRENAQLSTGPKSAEGKLASRQNSTTHALTSQVALPREIMEEMTGHFWQLANAYKPTNAIAVNCILELTMCAWKNRRLFEQYAVNNARSKQTDTNHRASKNQRLAQHWFQKLQADPPRAIIKLSQSTEGLTLLIQTAQTLLMELLKSDGTGFWSVHQFHLALALKGSRPTEVWNHPDLRIFWSSWMAIHPHSATCVEQCNNHTNVEREYHGRISEAIENRPQPDQGRSTLKLEIQQLITTWSLKHQSLKSNEDALEPLDRLVAGVPTGRESNQNLLHLRYVSSNDRKTRDLHALLLSFPSHDNPSDWQFDLSMLPSDWRSVLIDPNRESAHDQAIHQIYEPIPQQFQESIEQSIFRNATSAQNHPVHCLETSEDSDTSSSIHETKGPMAALGARIEADIHLNEEAQLVCDSMMKEFLENQRIRNLESIRISNQSLLLEKHPVKEHESPTINAAESVPAMDVPMADASVRPRRFRNDRPRPAAPSKKPSERRKKSAGTDAQSPRLSPLMMPLNPRPITSV